MYWLTGILGGAFAAAPFLLGYADNQVALWTSVLLGGAVMVVSFIEAGAEDKERWEYWVAISAGIGAIVAPFILGFGAHASAMWTSVAVGMLIALTAGYKLYSDQPKYG